MWYYRLLLQNNNVIADVLGFHYMNCSNDLNNSVTVKFINTKGKKPKKNKAYSYSGIMIIIKLFTYTRKITFIYYEQGLC